MNTTHKTRIHIEPGPPEPIPPDPGDPPPPIPEPLPEPDEPGRSAVRRRVTGRTARRRPVSFRGGIVRMSRPATGS